MLDNDVSLFLIQMLGSCPVDQAQGSGCTDEAVQKIVANTKKVCVACRVKAGPNEHESH